jgi:type I restriction enzyme S subunit
MTSTIPLGELVTIRGGGTPSRAIPEYWNGSIRWATVKDFKSTELAETQESITPAGIRDSATNIIPAGSVIIPTRMAVGKAAISTIDMAINQDLKALLPTGEVDTRFLLHFMLSHGDYLESQAQGATVKGIKLDLLRSLPFPRLPRTEQRRIAAILDKADAIRRKREQALTLADDFLRSVFLEMFGEPNTNRMGLKKVPLGDIIKVSSGTGLVGKDMAADGIYPVYGGNGINGYHSEYMFEEPQIVIGRVGAYCGAVHVSASKSWVTDNALYIRTYKQPINKTYLEWALRFANLNQYAGRAAQPLISGGRIYEVEILVPNDADQLSFHLIAQRHSALVSNLKGDAVNSGDLFAALSQRAFAGDL